MKCNQPRLRFEIVSPCPFPTSITITPRAPPCKCCKFIIHSISYSYKHKSRSISRKMSFLSKMVFFLLFVCPSRSLYLLTNQYDIPLGDLSLSVPASLLFKVYLFTSLPTHKSKTLPETKRPAKITHKLNLHKNIHYLQTMRNRRHLSLYFVGTRKMQAPKP